MKHLLIAGIICTSAFTTTAQTIILDEDFQGASIPANWTVVISDTFHVDTDVNTDNVNTNLDFDNGWITLADPDNVTDTIAGASSFFTTPGQADRWLITPPVTLGAFGNFLTWNARSHDPSYQDGYYVMVSTTDNQVASFTDTIVAIGFEDSEWQNRSISLSDEGYDNQTIYLGFRLRSYDKFKLYIDDVQVRKDDPVAITEQSNDQLVLYPNPTNDFIRIQGEGLISMRILSVNGQVVLNTTLNGAAPVSVAHLPSGVYVVAVSTQSGIAYKRMVKK